MLTSLDNQVVFKKAFQDKLVFKTFVHDVLGISPEIENIETEKRFSPKVGNIDFAFDIFAESVDHRFVIELQRVDYDGNFDRFLHYHNMAICELQRSSRNYKIEQTVCSVIILTAPYRLREKDGQAVKDEFLLSDCDPRTLDGQVRRLYGHKLLFLNPNFKNDTTPQEVRDWMKLFHDSINNPNDYKVNLNNPGISRTVEIIDYDHILRVPSSQAASL